MVMSNVYVLEKELYFIPLLEIKVYPYRAMNLRDLLSTLSQEPPCSEILFNFPPLK